MALLDVWMPETSGLQMQARLHEVSPDKKVILMTGRETPAVCAAALERGAFGFLLKPFDDEVFRRSSTPLREVSDAADRAARHRTKVPYTAHRGMA